MDGAAPSRVLRLELLKSLLADRDVATAPDLAAELGVSVRTVPRDLSTRRKMGIPIEGERGSGTVGVNGAAARLVHPGDVVLVIAYGTLSDEEARGYQPRVILVDERNRIVHQGHQLDR